MRLIAPPGIWVKISPAFLDLGSKFSQGLFCLPIGHIVLRIQLPIYREQDMFSKVPSDSPQTLDRKINELLCWIVESHNQYYGFGSMTCAIYDTAWVLMVSKRVKGELQWLFPETFQYVLSSQDASGGWNSSSSGSEIDSLLISMAALLTIRKHASGPCKNNGGGEDLLTTVYRRAAFVQTQLQSWDVESTTHVGFELLVPNLLDNLE